MTKPPLGNRDFIRALNRSTVLNTIKLHGPIARAEVARMTGLSPATVTGITADLIAENLVFEKSAGDSSGGRRPILLAINPRGAFVIGIKLTETQIISALTDLEANVLAKCTDEFASKEPAEAIDALSEVIARLIAKAGIPGEKVLGVGIGLAGIVDAQQGILRQSPILGWRDVPLKALLQDVIQKPVYIDNDVNTLTLTEKWFGSGQGVDHFLTVTIGRGVGLGVVVNGQFYRGAGGGAGEFGHTVIDPAGPECCCGKRGCLESFISDPALIHIAKQAVTEKRIASPVNNIEDLYHLASAGNPVVKQILAAAGEILGRGIANLINVFDPQLVIISGEGNRWGELVFAPMRLAITDYVLPGLAPDVVILVEPWGDDAWARGAASLVLRELFESPVHRESVPLPEG